MAGVGGSRARAAVRPPPCAASSVPAPLLSPAPAGEHLAQLHAPLVERVDAPHKPAGRHAVLVHAAREAGLGCVCVHGGGAVGAPPHSPASRARQAQADRSGPAPPQQLAQCVCVQLGQQDAQRRPVACSESQRGQRAGGQSAVERAARALASSVRPAAPARHPPVNVLCGTRCSGTPSARSVPLSLPQARASGWAKKLHMSSSWLLTFSPCTNHGSGSPARQHSSRSPGLQQPVQPPTPTHPHRPTAHPQVHILLAAHDGDELCGDGAALVDELVEGVLPVGAGLAKVNLACGAQGEGERAGSAACVVGLGTGVAALWWKQEAVCWLAGRPAPSFCLPARPASPRPSSSCSPPPPPRPTRPTHLSGMAGACRRWPPPCRCSPCSAAGCGAQSAAELAGRAEWRWWSGPGRWCSTPARPGQAHAWHAWEQAAQGSCQAGQPSAIRLPACLPASAVRPASSQAMRAALRTPQPAPTPACAARAARGAR